MSTGGGGGGGGFAFPDRNVDVVDVAMGGDGAAEAGLGPRDLQRGKKRLSRLSWDDFDEEPDKVGIEKTVTLTLTLTLTVMPSHTHIFILILILTLTLP